MLFQASRAVTASSEKSRFISVSEYAPPSTSLLILACIETLGANSGANQLPARVLELTRIRQEGLAPFSGRDWKHEFDDPIQLPRGPLNLPLAERREAIMPTLQAMASTLASLQNKLLVWSS
jgi:hypothetical protein